MAYPKFSLLISTRRQPRGPFREDSLCNCTSLSLLKNRSSLHLHTPRTTSHNSLNSLALGTVRGRLALGMLESDLRERFAVRALSPKLPDVERSGTRKVDIGKVAVSSTPPSNNIRSKIHTRFNHSFHSHTHSTSTMQFTTAILALFATGVLAAPHAEAPGKSGPSSQPAQSDQQGSQQGGSGSGHEGGGGKGSTAIGNGNTETNTETNICSNKGNAAFCCPTANNNSGLLALLGLNGLGGGSCTGLTGGSDCSTGTVMCCPNSAIDHTWAYFVRRDLFRSTFPSLLPAANAAPVTRRATIAICLPHNAPVRALQLSGTGSRYGW
ncbi:uncharacterized protein MYCFIDRAFT_171629 [Pseudocercospora fijiensis CIRAD86]|uniref:Hydrophobin n=1 Tax=Pseudocercospora fijiensis (strain CIRAD86) TaxID=383855 RepID=M3A3U4_PSEFD|nr:uncharacterized protein MYCFIDRAFT_171629 [Pseudocercospora fijiensis CIRAD86]EME85754.1 hypothetical protein MYCFIDRAFT_171629 [Pseudocercospora fijiensis CIRAD86]